MPNDQSRAISRNQQIALIALFSAVAMVLRLTVEVPFPLAAYLKLEVWEIPVYIVLLAYRPKLGLGVACIVYVIVQIFSSGPLIMGPVYNFIAVLSTLGGVSLVLRLTDYKMVVTKSIKMPLVAIASGMAFRFVIMTVVNFLVLTHPPPVGFSIPVEALPPVLLVTGIFNIIVAGYSVAISFPIARRIISL